MARADCHLLVKTLKPMFYRQFVASKLSKQFINKPACNRMSCAYEAAAVVCVSSASVSANAGL
jgi:hypothetical protein